MNKLTMNVWLKALNSKNEVIFFIWYNIFEFLSYIDKGGDKNGKENTKQKKTC